MRTPVAPAYVQPYLDAFERHGGGFESLLWASPHTQRLRFDAIRRAIESEFACTLGDILIRRTKVAFHTRDNGRALARTILPEVAKFFAWDDARSTRELQRYDAEVRRTFTIDP